MVLTDISEKSLVRVRSRGAAVEHQNQVSLILLNLLVLQRRRRVSEVPTHCVLADEEFLPFKENTFDLVVSSLR